MLDSEDAIEPIFPALAVLACKALKDCGTVSEELGRQQIFGLMLRPDSFFFSLPGGNNAAIKEVVDALPGDGLVIALSHESDDIREAAARRLPDYPGAATIDILNQALNDRSFEVRQAAADMIFDSPDERAYSLSTERLSGPWPHAAPFVACLMSRWIQSPWFLCTWWPNSEDAVTAARAQGIFPIHRMADEDWNGEWGISRTLARFMVLGKVQHLSRPVEVRVGKAVPQHGPVPSRRRRDTVRWWDRSHDSAAPRVSATTRVRAAQLARVPPPTRLMMETVDVGLDVGRIERRGRRGSGSRVGGWNSCGPDAVHDSTGSARFRVSGHP